MMREDNAVAAGTQTPATASLSGLRRGAFAGYRWLLLIFLLLGMVQIFLAGFGVFGLHGREVGAPGETAFDPHRTLGFALGGMALIILILALFYGTSVCSEEVEGKTLPYLITRPIPRAAVVLGKYAAYTAIMTGLVTLGLLFSFLVLNLDRLLDPQRALGAAGAFVDRVLKGR